jgi:hypothetical protein
LLVGDEGFDRLVLRAEVDVEVELALLQRLAVGPDIADPVDRPLADGVGDVGEIGVFDGLGGLAAAGGAADPGVLAA